MEISHTFIRAPKYLHFSSRDILTLASGACCASNPHSEYQISGFEITQNALQPGEMGGIKVNVNGMLNVFYPQGVCEAMRSFQSGEVVSFQLVLAKSFLGLSGCRKQSPGFCFVHAV